MAPTSSMLMPIFANSGAQVLTGKFGWRDRRRPALEGRVSHAEVAVPGGAHRQRDVRGHPGPQPRAVTLDLGSGTEVHHRADAAAAQLVEIVVGQRAQAVGAEQRPGPHVAAARCGIAAQITAIPRAFQHNYGISTHGLAG